MESGLVDIFAFIGSSKAADALVKAGRGWSCVSLPACLDVANTLRCVVLRNAMVSLHYRLYCRSSHWLQRPL